MQFHLAVLVTVAWGADGPEAVPAVPRWACRYHTLLSHSGSKTGPAWDQSMMAERGAWATGWYGAWWIQHQVERLGQYDAIRYVERFRNQGLKNVFYFDAGEHGEFVALISDEGRLLRSQWELRFYRHEPGRLMWFGKDAFYRDEDPLRLKNYRGFGLPPWRLPDGTRPKTVYDLAQHTLDGVRDRWTYSGVRVSDETSRELHIEEFLRSGPDPVPAEAEGSLGRICSYDHSNPFLLADFQAGVGLMLTLRPAFLHFDNYFDNEVLYPAQQAFGPWSLEKFRRFLRAHPEEARAAGVEDPDAFDLRQYLAAERGKRPAAVAWRDRRWHTDPVWNLFVCSKLADSVGLFRQLYAFCKSESRRQGEEVIVAGNTIPLFPGATHAAGALDLAHFEHHAAVPYGPIRVPTGLPPRGRLGGVVRLGAALSRVGYCWPSVYVPQELSGARHENLHRVMAFDCLANCGVLDYGHQYLKGYSPGTDESAAWINSFIKSRAEDYGRRRPWSEVGLVFPGDTLLGNVSVFSLDPEPALYDYLGWAQALTELHVQWDVLTDLQLADERPLDRYRALILPSAACLSDSAIAALKRFVETGGRLLLSGPAGTRYGPEQFLRRRAEDASLAARLASWSTGAVQSLSALGRGFYEDVGSGERTKNREEMLRVVLAALDNRPRLETNASTRVGCYCFRDQDSAVVLDVVNYDLDLVRDELRPAQQVQVAIHPPPGRTLVPESVVIVLAEGQGPAAHGSARPVPARFLPDGRLRLDLPDVSVYGSIRIALKSAL